MKDFKAAEICHKLAITHRMSGEEERGDFLDVLSQAFATNIKEICFPDLDELIEYLEKLKSQFKNVGPVTKGDMIILERSIKDHQYLIDTLKRGLQSGYIKQF